MDYDKKNLAKGVKEMRAVAKRLTAWADDLEKLMRPENSEVCENAERAADPAVAAFVPDRAPVVGGESAEDVKAAEPAEAPAAAETPAAPVETPAAPPTVSEVKTFLTKLCAAGYAPQVKALIASYGATNLSGVPVEALAELMDTARKIGGEQDAR